MIVVSCARRRIHDQPARVLAALYQAGGRILSRDYLLDEVLPRGSADACSSKHLDVVICKIRRAAGFDAIQTHPGLGYSITDLGRLVCDEALEAQARAA
ncbi:response regulator with CheY-like receiver domain and winged-helix DNA-binding domain [Caulobacter sp. AP07]|uniref:helix-turn-helix domain-containing protein n=1 Tax=Caulobacter sp. AP07 TaxID=1144304 RepID=UPI0002721AD1|nr:helix-turn-helix domain-containing protein [Caulobacter sp. AP07]EJL36573.1 response regulator with CheY-like receiver domain and winged-helix DNA-binding domain [Caulobacter sp. AP07]